jgi:hypothetical protein
MRVRRGRRLSQLLIVEAFEQRIQVEALLRLAGEIEEQAALSFELGRPFGLAAGERHPEEQVGLFSIVHSARHFAVPYANISSPR